MQKLLTRLPVIGDPVERFLGQVKDALKAGMLGGMLFEELGFRYIGPGRRPRHRPVAQVSGHGRDAEGPVLLHVVTEKGHGFAPAVRRPGHFPHAGRLSRAATARSWPLAEERVAVLHRRGPRRHLRRMASTRRWR